MNDQYHWRKAKPEKFNHSLTQVILNEAYLNIHLKAVETLDFSLHFLEYVITNKKRNLSTLPPNSQDANMSPSHNSVVVLLEAKTYLLAVNLHNIFQEWVKRVVVRVADPHLSFGRVVTQKLNMYSNTQCTVGYQKSPDSLFFKALNRIISLSRDQKIMKRSLLDSPWRDASNGGLFMFLGSIDDELSSKNSKQ